MNKLSDKLSALIASEDPNVEVNLHVMLRKDLEGDNAEAVVHNLEQLASDKNQVKVFPLSGMVTLRGTLETVEKIAENPNVVWIDRDSEAPLEELLDE